MSRLTVERESHTAGSGGSCWWQIHIPDCSPCQGLCRGAADPTDPTLAVGAAGEVVDGCCLQGAVSATRLQLPLLLVPFQSSQVCWPFPFTFPPFLWPDMDLCTGKEGTWEAFSNRCLDSQGVFQHGSQRPLQVHWEWEVQNLSRTLARKLLLSVCLAASKWEGTALRFQILPNTHSCKWEPL